LRIEVTGEEVIQLDVAEMTMREGVSLNSLVARLYRR